MRHTKMWFTTGKTRGYSDNWKELGEQFEDTQEWTGLTQFTIGPDNSIPDIMNESKDFWFKDHYNWIRVHVVPRYALFTPHGTRNGPTNPDRLRETRRTTCYLPNGEQTLLEDNWKVDGHRPLTIQWTGTTEFEENVEEPMEPPATYGRVPTALQLPAEPTRQERELHNLTHIPFQSWCTIRVKAKGRADHHHK
jgi:hypothetical protein